MKKVLVIGTGIIYLLYPLSLAYAKHSSACSGILLKNHTSVRAEGMGAAQAAVATDESGAQGFNPAGLAGNRSQGISAVYYRGVVDDAFGALHYDMPWGEDLTCGGSFIFYDAGNFEWNSFSGETGNVSAQRDLLVTLTAAYKLNIHPYEIPVGANLKFLHSTLLNEYTGFAAAVDLGTRFELADLLDHLYVGLALRNLGTPIKYVESADPLPAYALLGLAYDLVPTEYVMVLVAGDAQYDLENTWRGNLGAEVRVADLLALRAGYKIGYALGSFTMGLGFQSNNISLDYAFSPMPALNSLHRISLKYNLGLVPTSSSTPATKPASPAPAAPKPAPASKPKAQPVRAYVPKATAPKTAIPAEKVEKVNAGILEIQRVGGQVSKVILNVGSNHRIKVGFNGVILDSTGQPIAGIIVRQVDPEISLAEVFGLCRDIDNNAMAVIDIPL